MRDLKLIFKAVLTSSKEITSTVNKKYTNEANLQLGCLNYWNYNAFHHYRDANHSNRKFSCI